MPIDVAALGPGDVLAEKFRVIRRLGEGGMGAVFEVEHLLTRHRRALKLLHAHVSKNTTTVQRFLREASAAGRIGNPHIAETFDAGQLPTGEYYLVMEYLRGHTLGSHPDHLRRPLAASELVELIGQVCEAIAAAHAAGVVHRDLKPDNLFVIDVGGQPFVKVLDFGISKFDRDLTAATPLTHEGNLLGTPYYMSPEQFRGDKHLDGRSDLYSLGVILYELASGRRPYEGDSLFELVSAINRASPTPLEQLRPDLPPSLVRAMERAMHSERDLRPASASAFAQELRAALVGAPAAPMATFHPPSARPALPPAPTPLGLAATLSASGVFAQTPLAASSPPASPSAPPPARHGLGVVVGVLVTLLAGGTFWRLTRSAQDSPGPSASAPRENLAPAGLVAPASDGAPRDSSGVQLPVAVLSASADRASASASASSVKTPAVVPLPVVPRSPPADASKAAPASPARPGAPPSIVDRSDFGTQ